MLSRMSANGRKQTLVLSRKYQDPLGVGRYAAVFDNHLPRMRALEARIDANRRMPVFL